MTDKLTNAELKVLALMRSLNPYEVIEIKLDNQLDLAITVKSTVRETFPRLTGN